MKLSLTLALSVFGLILMGQSKPSSADGSSSLFNHANTSLNRLLPDIKKASNKLAKVSKVGQVNHVYAQYYNDDKTDNNILIDVTFTAPGGKPDYTSEDLNKRQGLVPIDCKVQIHNHGFDSKISDELLSVKC